MTRSDRTNASFVNQARRVALRCAKTARAEDQIRHLMFSVVTPERVNLVSSRRAREAGTAARSRVSTRTAKPEVHVRNTSRVTSPTPFGVQKQNWRVRRLVSSRRGPPFFASGGHPRSRRSGRWVAGWVCNGRRARLPYHERGVSPARSESRDSSGRPPSHDRGGGALLAAGESAQLSLESTRLDHSRGSSRQRSSRLTSRVTPAHVRAVSRGGRGDTQPPRLRISCPPPRLKSRRAPRSSAPGASMPRDRACVLILGLG